RWMNEIPDITFDEGWRIRVIPPFAGAVARFRVNEHTSVYLDCYDDLGCVGQPYWEVHPVDGDVGRALMNEVDELLDLIRQSVSECETHHTPSVEA
ncbi:MAG: hypothetical protein AAF662_02350, partial [Pseudomonadota bacterium]